MPEQEVAPPLSEFIELNDMHKRLSALFPTPDAMRWFYRVHRAELAQRGCVILIANRLFFHPRMFEESVRDIGRATMRQRFGL